MSAHSHRLLSIVFSAFLSIAAVLTLNCSAQTEEQALKSLRDMTKDDKFPSEDYVAGIESRFAGRKAGALAKLLHARIRLENNDFVTAAALLNTDVIAKQTRLGDYALWLRGKALQGAGNHTEAMNAFSNLLRDFPASIRFREAKIGWATSAIAAGRAGEVPAFLADLADKNDADALLLAAKAYDAQSSQPDALKYYRRTYFFAAGSNAAKEAEAKLSSLAQPLTPQTAEEARVRADQLYQARNYTEASTAYTNLVNNFPNAASPAVRLRQVTTLSSLKRMPDAQSAFNAIPSTASEKEEAYYQLAIGYARSRNWPAAHQLADDMRLKYPSGKLVPKTFIDLGLEARGKNATEEGYYLKTAVSAFPNAIEVAQAQFELAWYEHEQGNSAQSSQMFTEHLARYVDKDTTNRGKAGYWAARDSERAGKIAEACTLYNAVNYRYGANWYGYLATGRLANLNAQGKCGSASAMSELVSKAVANLKIVTAAPETAGQRELDLAAKSDDLSSVGLFDWAIDELTEAKKTANNSPKINFALARHYRMKNDNVNALLALAKSYPDYSQMFPEEMSREEWDVFYPLSNWNEIKYWAAQRKLDPFQVAGLIRQESVFNPRARSGANAFGLMQLLVPTAQVMARKYGSQGSVSSEALYQPPLNIELGTAYMRDMFDKFGMLELVAVAYNAGPNRVVPWRSTLPAEMDEFVEAIPFKETKGYVQGVIRNAAQYRRLYDENGVWRSNVGARPLRGEIDTRSSEELRAEFPDLSIGTPDGGE